MRIVGLTGSIAQGKSATAQMFRDLGVPVFDADAAVHTAYGPGGAAVPAIESLCPEAVIDGAVDRSILGQRVMADPGLLRQIEQRVHPIIWRLRHRVFLTASQRQVPYVVMDVPLLFETQSFVLCDDICVVSSPAWLQRQRALVRLGMTDEKLRYILSRQVPDTIKRDLASHVIPTRAGYAVARRHVMMLDRHFRRSARQGPSRWQPGGLRARPFTGVERFKLRRVSHA